MAPGADRIDGERRRYASYLLRLWQTQQEGALIWRASLESSTTGERQGFAGMADLYAFLEQVTALIDEDKPGSHAAKCGDDHLGVS